MKFTGGSRYKVQEGARYTVQEGVLYKVQSPLFRQIFPEEALYKVQLYHLVKLFGHSFNLQGKAVTDKCFLILNDF